MAPYNTEKVFNFSARAMLPVLSIAIVILGCERKQVSAAPATNAPLPSPPSYSVPQPAAPPVQEAPPVKLALQVRGEETQISTPPPEQTLSAASPVKPPEKTEARASNARSDGDNNSKDH